MRLRSGECFGAIDPAGERLAFLNRSPLRRLSKNFVCWKAAAFQHTKTLFAKRPSALRSWARGFASRITIEKMPSGSHENLMASSLLTPIERIEVDIGGYSGGGSVKLYADLGY